jgi:hypothetical protein
LSALVNAPADRLRHLIIYASDADAAGFAPRERGKKARAS